MFAPTVIATKRENECAIASQISPACVGFPPLVNLAVKHIHTIFHYEIYNYQYQHVSIPNKLDDLLAMAEP